MRTKNKKE